MIVTPEVLAPAIAKVHFPPETEMRKLSEQGFLVFSGLPCSQEIIDRIADLAVEAFADKKMTSIVAYTIWHRIISRVTKEQEQPLQLRWNVDFHLALFAEFNSPMIQFLGEDTIRPELKADFYTDWPEKLIQNTENLLRSRIFGRVFLDWSTFEMECKLVVRQLRKIHPNYPCGMWENYGIVLERILKNMAIIDAG